MKITSLISASAIALALAAPVYAQTAPTTPAPTTPAPTTPAPTTPAPTTPAPTPAPTGIPAAYVNVAAVQQVNAQLTAQGYTITDVVQNANGSYSVLSTSATGQLRLITVNPATGGVTDTVTAGVPAGTTGVAPGGQFDNDGDDRDDGDDRNGDDDDSGDDDHNGRDDSNDDDDSGSDDDGEDDSNDSDD